MKLRRAIADIPARPIVVSIGEANLCRTEAIVVDTWLTPHETQVVGRWGRIEAKRFSDLNKMDKGGVGGGRCKDARTDEALPRVKEKAGSCNGTDGNWHGCWSLPSTSTPLWSSMSGA